MTTRLGSARNLSRSTAPGVLRGLVAGLGPRLIIAREESRECAFVAGGDLGESGGLAVQLDVLGVDHMQLGAMQADIVANLLGEQGMLLRRIVADQQHRRGVEHIAHAARWLPACRPAKRPGQGSRRCDGGRCCWSAAPCARTSAADNFLRWWCGWIR